MHLGQASTPLDQTLSIRFTHPRSRRRCVTATWATHVAPDQPMASSWPHMQPESRDWSSHTIELRMVNGQHRSQRSSCYGRVLKEKKKWVVYVVALRLVRSQVAVAVATTRRVRHHTNHTTPHALTLLYAYFSSSNELSFSHFEENLSLSLSLDLEQRNRGLDRSLWEVSSDFRSCLWIK